MITNGVYEGWQSNNAPVASTWNVQCFNQQEIELQGLVAEDLHWNSNTVRIEQAEPSRAFFGAFKDPNPAEYGFLREYHIFTTKKMDSDMLNDLFQLQNPMMPGMVGSVLNENQLVFGVARESSSVANLKTDGVTFANDWRLMPTYENILGNGYPVAQGRIFYTRAVYCWLNAAGGGGADGLFQGLDMPQARVSLVGETVKPKNFNDHMAVLANNEGIGNW